jgi:hypothetical protein
VVDDDTPSAPVLSRPSSFLGAPTTDERPTSSHGSVRSTNSRQSPLDKELPALPHCLSELPGDVPQEEFEEAEDGERLDDFSITFAQKARSHFSTWSNDSIAYSSPTSDDDEAVLSPTFSSLTSNDSDVETPQGLLIRYSYTEQENAENAKRTSTVPEIVSHDVDNEVFEVFAEEEEEDTRTPYLSSTPPQLNEVRISTFGPDLFGLDAQRPSSETSSRRSSRRQAACFGLGFQYSLPDDETTSKTTVTGQDEGQTLERTISVQRESSMSQMNALMEDFGFLGDAVI